jgi:hypothetical protein
MDPIIALMAILGIGGGFAGLWWGWLAGEVEADMRRVACEFRSLSEMIDRGTVGFKELARSVDAMMISAMQFNVAMAETYSAGAVAGQVRVGRPCAVGRRSVEDRRAQPSPTPRRWDRRRLAAVTRSGWWLQGRACR